MEPKTIRLSILVEDTGDGDLVPFITSEETLAGAQKPYPDAVILHKMLVVDDSTTFSHSKKQQLVSTLEALMTLGNLMDGYEIEDLFMRFFQEGFNAGMQYSNNAGIATKSGQIDDPVHVPSELEISQ